MTSKSSPSKVLKSRRNFLRQAAVTGAGAALSSGALSSTAYFASAFAKDEPPIGTWPAGSSGDSVFIGITVPRTGTYAVQGEDELKAM